ncbi:alpha/beta hydrolase [Bartonella machadoae]|uniref:alpha/beta hydrolase n=1 Tax=Bartonella machadoae TaxID=2893471 RepID=UPI001F4C7AA9|nr:alpha/beta hydrolase [Bartonella machadoae]UNE55620.1 alpha/beta hydrolase [Bartonella machadoae]
MNNDIPCQFFSFKDTALAVRHRKGSSSLGLFCLHGYLSDMSGDKVMFVDRFAQKNDLSCLRFDYSGHGESGGDFFQGTISRWVQESLAVFEAYCEGPQILIGTSMGGWIALKLAMMLAQKNKRLAGMVLIAPAPDFTKTLIESGLGRKKWKILEETEHIERSEISYTEPVPFTKVFIEDGRDNCVMKGCIDVGCPIHILQGMEDVEIPYQHTLNLLNHLPLHDVTLTLVRDADHRFSRPQDADCLEMVLRSLIDRINREDQIH